MMRSLHKTSPAARPPTPLWQVKALRLPGDKVERYIDPATGIRFYPIPAPDGDGLMAVPGVTSLLSAADTPEEKQRLRDWRDREIAAGRDPNAGRDRGTRVHGLLENYIRGISSPDASEEDLDFFTGMERHLDGYEEFLWSERPLISGWEHCWNAPEGHPDRLARVWNWLYGYGGTPDLLARRRRGRVVLGDFKSSSRPYYRCSGRPVPRWHETGYKKYKKTVRQLCAYKMAVEQTLDLHVDMLQIIVGLPKRGEAQMFYIEGAELELETERFKQAALQFWQVAPSAAALRRSGCDAAQTPALHR